MGVPEMVVFPCDPHAEPPRNSCFIAKNPASGINYSSGTKAGSHRMEPMHGGNDLHGAEGKAKCRAAWKAGRVKFVAHTDNSGWGIAYGNSVQIEYNYTHEHGTPGKRGHVTHKHRWYETHNHMKVIDPAIKRGARVKAGQLIGAVGKTGKRADGRPAVTGAHDHYAVQLRPEHKSQVVNVYALLIRAMKKARR